MTAKKAAANTIASSTPTMVTGSRYTRTASRVHRDMEILLALRSSYTHSIARIAFASGFPKAREKRLELIPVVRWVVVVDAHQLRDDPASVLPFQMEQQMYGVGDLMSNSCVRQLHA